MILHTAFQFPTHIEKGIFVKLLLAYTLRIHVKPFVSHQMGGQANNVVTV